MTSFKIARYILFIFVLILCIWIIAWIMFSDKTDTGGIKNVDDVIRITQK